MQVFLGQLGHGCVVEGADLVAGHLFVASKSLEQRPLDRLISERFVADGTHNKQLRDRRTFEHFKQKVEAVATPMKVVNPEDDGLVLAQDRDQASERLMALLRAHPAPVTDQRSEQLRHGSAPFTGAEATVRRSRSASASSASL